MSLIKLSQVQRDINIPVYWRELTDVQIAAAYSIPADTNWHDVPSVTYTFSPTEVSDIRCYAQIMYTMTTAGAGSAQPQMKVVYDGVDHIINPFSIASLYYASASTYYYTLTHITWWIGVTVASHTFKMQVREANAITRAVAGSTMFLDIKRQ